VFQAAQGAFADLSAGAFVASFVGTMLMFLVPITLLGTVSPWAIRLSVKDVETAGSVAGRLYAISTVGSIIGTFLPVLVLVPAIGTRRTLFLIAAVLALAAVPLLGARAIAVPVVLVGMMFLPVGTIKQEPGEKVLFEAESPYQYVQVSEAADGQRILRLNEGWALHSVVPAGGGALTGGYWDAFLTLPLLTGTPDARIAILGNAGGTTARSFRLTSPQVRIDGVEIDPVVTEAGNRYLDMAGPNLTTHEADARFWLAGDRGPFDAVIVDAYRQPYIPFHLSTVEFFEEVRDRLAPGGVAAINVGTPPDQTEVVHHCLLVRADAGTRQEAEAIDDGDPGVGWPLPEEADHGCGPAAVAGSALRTRSKDCCPAADGVGITGVFPAPPASRLDRRSLPEDLQPPRAAARSHSARIAPVRSPRRTRLSLPARAALPPQPPRHALVDRWFFRLATTTPIASRFRSSRSP
jgi:predicted membrane-bound spermidine synthase